jgi:hypothetical protein
MRTFITLGLLLAAVGGTLFLGATERKAATRAKYYRKSPRPSKNATRGPKHKDQNYDQHGWN